MHKFSLSRKEALVKMREDAFIRVMLGEVGVL
jgi:hypothetical protein